MTSTPIRAFYFDGKTSLRHDVTLQVQDDMARVEDQHAALVRATRLQDLRVSERFTRAARKVTFTDGAYLEILDAAAFAELLRQTRHHDSWVVRMQHNWRATLAALAGLIGVLLLAYLYLLPAVADVIARTLPPGVEQRIGAGTLDFLDQHIFAPTRLPPARQQQLRAQLQTLTAPLTSSGELPPVELIFRRSLIGPNALALPSGQIVLTDEIVQLLQDDEVIMGVLAHELGHVQRRHLMRRLIQGSLIAAGTTLLFGDVSVVLANVPTVLLDLKYSRDIEREADDYALALFQKNGISRQKLAEVFIRLEQQKHDTSQLAPYLSTHPGNAERIQRILQAP